MDENKTPHEENWLDELLEPTPEEQELGPDVSVLDNDQLLDPSVSIPEVADPVDIIPEEAASDNPTPEDQSDTVPESGEDGQILGETTVLEESLPTDVPEEPESTVGVDTLLLELPALLSEEAPAEPEDPPHEATEPEPFRDEDYRDTFGEGAELAQVFEDTPPAPPDSTASTGTEKETEKEPPMKKGRPKRKKGYGLLGIPHILVTLVWLAIIAVIGITLGRMMWLCVADILAFGQVPREATIVITQDDDLDSIAKKLHDAKLINYPSVFSAFADLTGKGERISVGTFTFNEPDPDTGKIPGIIYDYNAIINSLREYAPTRKVVNVVVPEGYSCAQLFALLEEKGVSTVAELEEHAANGELKEYWFLENVERGSKYCLEGYLFPDTYQFYTNDDPQRVLEKFLNNFNVKFSDLMKEKLVVLNEKLTAVMEKRGFSAEEIAKKQLTVKEIVIVASMVEKEAGAVLESYDISSVIYNRLYRWELPYLNIDATIVYALGGKTDPLTLEDLQVDSPFNTYTHMGLTPGAIANPGLTSLNAALDPNDTDYFYYALNPETNEHKFSKTEQEHNDFLAKIKNANE